MMPYCHRDFWAPCASSVTCELFKEETRFTHLTAKGYEELTFRHHYLLIPHEVTTCYHEWDNHKCLSSDGSKHQVEGQALSDEFHTYGLEWNNEWLIFYMDRKELRRAPNKNCFMPANILLSEAILTWGGEITDAIDGTFMEVDYVRVYQAKDKTK